MSKKLIAGAGVVASFAIALAPLATFATVRDTASDTHTDELKINVPAACSFGSVAGSIAGVAHTGSNATWTQTTADDMMGLIPDRELENNETPDPRTRHDSEDTFSAAYTVYAGTVNNDVARTVLTVFCNDVKQPYTLTAKLDQLTHTDGTTVINPDGTYSASNTGYALYSITGAQGNVGDVVSGAASLFDEDSEATIATSGTAAQASDPVIAASGDVYTIQYGVGIKSDQKAGVYTGTVEYNLYQGVAD